MADIELVIKIPEEMYKDIQSRDWKNGGRWYSEEWKAIHNGTPLPKGHGRLIDEYDLKILFGLDDRLWWSNAVEEFPDLPTIIEAESEE